ncbi:MAG: phosphoglycerate kinase [Candidatus Levybacteria bacterium]|nr:phosphoglycerate kinase [Candidatus Levybacteria bacterium]
MKYKLPKIQNANLAGKRVFVRADLDVPLSEVRGQRLEARVEDDTRLVAGLPTIHYLLEQGAKVIIGGHLGRPKGVDKSLSLEPVAEWLRQKFKVQSSKFKVRERDGFGGWEITPSLFLLENLRFYEGEERNPSTHSVNSGQAGSGQEFAQKLAKLADIYVNDAFAMCHRNHASIIGVASLLPHYAGLRLQKEVEILGQILENPKRPLIVVIGGQKIETKLPLIEKMENFADFVLVGGKIAQEAQKFKAKLNSKVIVASSNQEGTDITAESLNQFLLIIKQAKTIVWNGPMGRIGALLGNKNFLVPHSQTARHANSENFVPSLRQNPSPAAGSPRSDSERGTEDLAKAIVESSAYKVVGGGDTTEFIKRIGLFDKFDFVSTGGGAMLTFLSGEKLPGLEALTAD